MVKFRLAPDLADSDASSRRLKLRLSFSLRGLAATSPIQKRDRLGSAALVLVLAAVTLCLLSAVGYCVGRNTESELRFFELRRTPTADEACVVCPIEYALHSNERNDVVFVGDSTCRCGIDPAHFERESGLVAYDLGTQGRLGPMGFWIIAKAYLSKHPPPQVVVVCMSPVAFEYSAAEIADKMRATFQARFEANYGPEVPGLVPRKESLLYFVKRGSVAVWSAARACRTGRQKDVRDIPLFGARTATFRIFQQQMRESRGYYALPGPHGPKHELELPGEPVKIEAEWDRNVRFLAKTCENMGIPLLLRFSPMPSDLSRVKDFSPIQRWSEDLQRAYPKLTIGHPTLLWYDPKLCFDHIHLNAPGVAVYTSLLAKDVQDILRRAK
jgi:hypothetical protein